jgi:hypothetical protein
MAAATRLGHLTMPYFNPTCKECKTEAGCTERHVDLRSFAFAGWDPTSPSLAPFHRDFSSIAALNASGAAYYETYPDVPLPMT